MNANFKKSKISMRSSLFHRFDFRCTTFQCNISRKFKCINSKVASDMNNCAFGSVSITHINYSGATECQRDMPETVDFLGNRKNVSRSLWRCQTSSLSVNSEFRPGS
jgi:hypothetical protein